MKNHRKRVEYLMAAASSSIRARITYVQWWSWKPKECFTSIFHNSQWRTVDCVPQHRHKRCVPFFVYPKRRFVFSVVAQRLQMYLIRKVTLMKFDISIFIKVKYLAFRLIYFGIVRSQIKNRARNDRPGHKTMNVILRGKWKNKIAAKMSWSQHGREGIKRAHWGEKINGNDSETVRCSQKKNRTVDLLRVYEKISSVINMSIN